MPTVSPDPPAVRGRTLALVALVVALWCTLGIPVWATQYLRTTADEPEYLMTALSLGEDRSLDVGDERLGRRYHPFHAVLLPVQTKLHTDGSRVSPHDPLLPAVLAVPMRLGGWVAAKASLAVLAGALAAATLWVAVRRFRVPVATATTAVLAFALASPLAVYGTQVYPELPAALAVVAAIGCITGPLRRAGILGAVACVVALPWLAVKYAPVAAVLAVALLVRTRRRAAVVGAAVAMLAVAGVAYLAAHQSWYGGWTAYASGDHFVGGEFTATGTHANFAGRSVRLLGLLTDRHFGLAVWQPLFLATPVAIGALVRRRPAGWALALAVLAAGWLNATFVALTMHGFWWSGRQTVVVLPAVVLVVAWWSAQSTVARRVVQAGLVVGACNYAWFVVEGWARRVNWVVGFEATTAPFVRTLRVLLPDYRRHDALDWALHGVWLCVAASLFVAGYRLARRRPHLQPPNHDVLGSPNTILKETSA